MAGSFFLQALFRLRESDQVLVVTNPPLLPYVVVLAARLRGARTALLVHDVYPEVLEVTGIVPAGGLVARGVRRTARWLYRTADQVVLASPSRDVWSAGTLEERLAKLEQAAVPVIADPLIEDALHANGLVGLPLAAQASSARSAYLRGLPSIRWTRA